MLIWVNTVLVFAVVTVMIGLARRNIMESLTRARQSEMRYRVVSELISDYAFCLRFEPDGSTVSEWFTPGSFLRLTGYTVEEIISTTKLYHPDEVATLLRDLQDVQQGKTTDSDYRIITKSGEPRWLHMTRYPLWDDAHTRVVCYYGVAQDVTRRKQAEEKQREMAAAVEQERAHMLRRFLSDASHDLATPLAVLNTSLYLLRKVTDPEQQTRHIDQLGKQIDRIRLILADMFTLMHLDMADQEFACSVQPLNTLVEEVVQLQQPSAANRQLRLTLMLDGQNLTVCADREALSSAMQHVLTNALNFTLEGGCISVRTYSRDQAAFVEVSDTGVGISAENLPRIFDRFYRVDQARGSTNGGSGLGLTIVRKILQAHHGDVEVESVPGKGSTFRLWLPLSASASAVSEANAAVIPASPPTSEAINPVNQGTIETI
jgi:PAS domain S-box-containing protein